MSIFDGLFVDLECEICGALFRNAAKHQTWHDGINEIIRRVMFPEMDPEQFKTMLSSPEFVEQWRALRAVQEQLTEIEQQAHVDATMTDEQRKAAETIAKFFGGKP